MINTNELRIGNKVLLHGNPINVLGCIGNNVVVSLAGLKQEIWKEVFMPIPVTRDIIDRSGFDHPWTVDEYHRTEMATYRLIYDDFERAAFYVDVRYQVELKHYYHLPTRIDFLHQLQNHHFLLFNEELPVYL